MSPSRPGTQGSWITLTFALVLVIGFFDYLTGFELSLLVFYLLPICLAVATVDWRFGVVVSAASIASWLIGDFAAGDRFTKPFTVTWNALIALSTYLMVVWLLSSLLALQREMERRIQQRTAALTDEIAERERLERAVLEISERERRSIGHDLHDGLGQHLTGTALVAKALGERLSSRQDPEAAEMQKITELVESGIEQTRSLAKGLLLAEIERGGLVIALRDFAATTAQSFHVGCTCTVDGDIALDENGTATHLYRIAQEAVRNAIRHGKARNVEVGVSKQAGELVLTVADDGLGIAPAPLRGNGLGLRIMAHRASMIGARLSVAPVGDRGTRVVCTLKQPPAETGTL